jgi:hypothetical protein
LWLLLLSSSSLSFGDHVVGPRVEHYEPSVHYY